jgi:undecaprenyl-diphosphatase
MVKLIKSITKSIGHGVKNDPEIGRLKNKYPKTFSFLKKRFTKNHKYGFHFTLGILITLFFVYLFFGIVQDYIGQEKLVQFDLRVINLFSLLRHPKLNQQMLFITYLAKGQVIAFSLLIVSIILFLYKRWRILYTLIISVAGAEIFVWIIKNIIDRPRPPLTNSLVSESTYSFPSGHTFVAIAFYGLLVYFVIQSGRNKFFKIASFIFGLGLIILVGISRIYLGAHWPSDVFASVAVGSAWLTILITSLKIKKKFNPPKKIQINLKPKTLFFSSVSLITIWGIFVFYFFISHPLVEQKQIIPITKRVLETSQITSQLFKNLPKVSESISSVPAEPINIVVVGNRETLDNAFTNSGWYLLDDPSFKSYTKIITSLVFKQPYPQTPGLPVFWDTLPSPFSYGQPTSVNSVGSRHHVHFWETNYITQTGETIWLGTAHFDEAIKKKYKIILPFHRTQLIVDEERENIKSTLEKNGYLQSFEKINLTGLLYGTKKSGNNFLTDGQAYILYLKDETR